MSPDLEIQLIGRVFVYLVSGLDAQHYKNKQNTSNILRNIFGSTLEFPLSHLCPAILQ